MTTKIGFGTLFALLCLAGWTGHVGAQENQYTKTASGLRFKLIRSVPNAVRPSPGDVVELKMLYKNSRDSVLFDNRKGDFQFTHYLEKPAYPGDFNEALTLLGQGDSAVFILKADSFFLRTLRQPALPGFIQKGSDLRFQVSMLKVTPGQEYMKKQWEAMQQVNARNEQLRGQEMDSLRDYLQRNGITARPTSTGLYFLSLREGNGPQPVKGNQVFVEYSASLLNGKIIESSADAQRPLVMTVGIRSVIRGLEEGVLMMKKGGKATLIIPSSLGYGENQAGEVPPFTTLKYEVEIIDIK